MNRKDRRALKKEMKGMVRERPDTLTPIPKSEWPAEFHDLVIQAWVSQKYHVQLWREDRGIRRLSICRVTTKTDGRWVDNLSWDELQAIKSEVGYGDWYAVEVYPADKNVVNVANMRHLWLMPVPLPIGWRGDDGQSL